jgi:trehalose synthase
MLYRSIPFLSSLGVEAEWKLICGNEEYYKVTKTLHNMLQGQKGAFTPEMEEIYLRNLQESANASAGLIDYEPDVVLVHDPQPGLARHLRKANETWLWRCHIDIEETALKANAKLWDFATSWLEDYDAGIFSAAHYVVSQWPLPKFLIPPFIDPLSEKNRDLSHQEIDSVLARHRIDPDVPIIAQVGRFDPWKGLDRTIATFREVRKEVRCQLVLAGGLAGDDPEGKAVLADIYEKTADDEDIHVLELSLSNRLENYLEINALQRAAKMIMQPSTKEGFGLVITEALWKGKPVLAADAGGISLQIRNGDTGYFYQSPRKSAKRVARLLTNPSAAEAMGRRAKAYVHEHFLLPDRIADYLMALDIAVNAVRNKGVATDSIIGFHPWVKLGKRR